MWFLNAFLAISSCLDLVTAQEQVVLSHDPVLPKRSSRIAGTRRVAIIGAGASGSSAAYHLRQLASEANIALNITIFDKNNYIGGRAHTVAAYNDPSLPVELGASIFVSLNTILVNATQTFNLTSLPANDEIPDGYKGPTLGIWNGDDFVFQQSTEGGVWDTVKLFWRYGLAPVKTQRAVEGTVGAFLGMYESKWADLTEEVERLGLLELTAVTGEQFLRSKGVGDLFAREIIQAATRVNYAQNLGVINGMETMISMAPTGAQSVQGGNWRIFASMAQFATDDIRLETAVRKILRNDDGQFTLKIQGPPQFYYGGGDYSRITSESFDEVIIATPYQFSGLAINPALDQEPEKEPYVKLYVTLFTSPLFTSPRFFDLKPGQQVPLVVLTTLPPQNYNRDSRKPTYAGKAGFFSISLLRILTNPKTQEKEFLYKVFSPDPMTPEFLADILGVNPPRSFSKFKPEHVSWIYRKEWHSYPVEYPRVTFERIKLADGLWYSGAMDPFISTMETNALMGRNIARLISDEWQ